MPVVAGRRVDRIVHGPAARPMERVLRRLAIASLACFAYGTFVEPYDFRVRRVRLKVLPAGAQPIRVLHLSDIHLMPYQ